MRKQFKAPLFEKMLQYGNEFGLVHLTYPSFRCVTSYGNTQLAAADLVSGVAAVLENYDSVSPDAFAGGAFAAARSALLSATRDGIDRALKDGMQQALERAKEMLRATVAVGHSVPWATSIPTLATFTRSSSRPAGTRCASRTLSR